MKALPVVIALSLMTGIALDWMFADVDPAPLVMEGSVPSLPMFDAECDGNIMRADPRLTDENFLGALVVLCSSGPAGSLGLVVNHGIVKPVRALMPGAPAELGLLRRGGPLGKGQGVVLYRRDGALRFTSATTGTRFPHAGWLREPRVRDDEILAVALGYSAWSEGQLEDEAQQGAWLLTGISVDSALSEDRVKMWP